jgi:hypothetical protein
MVLKARNGRLCDKAKLMPRNRAHSLSGGITINVST